MASRPPSPDDDAARVLAAEIAHLGYRGLFAGPGGADILESLWRRPDAIGTLVAIATHARHGWYAQFLSCELLFSHRFDEIPREQHAPLAQVYRQALQENASGFMADWGLLTGPDDSGKLGAHIEFFGLAAAPALSPLLEDAREVPYLEPPVFPSTIRLGVQVRDFAVLYLRHILDIPFGDGDRGRLAEQIRRRL